MNTTCWHSRR